MRVEKKVYDIKMLSEILGFSVSSIHAHLARKNFSAVPPPFRLGRKLVWSVTAVDAFLEEKMQQAEDSR